MVNGDHLDDLSQHCETYSDMLLRTLTAPSSRGKHGSPPKPFRLQPQSADHLQVGWKLFQLAIYDVYSAGYLKGQARGSNRFD